MATQYRIELAGQPVLLLRPGSRELLRDGAAVELQPKVFDLLCHLVEHRARAVDKNELQDVIWAEQVVTEAAVSRAVMKARRALGDTAEAAGYIRTVHSRGFQFIAPVQSETIASEAAAVATAPDRAPPAPRRSWRWSAALLVLGLLAWAGWAIWQQSSRLDLPATGLARVAILPIDNRTGDTDQDWARIGLMNATGEVLSRAYGIDVIGSRQMLRLSEQLGEDPAQLQQTLWQRERASLLVEGELEARAGRLALNYTLTDAAGERRRRTLVADRVANLASGLASDIALQFDDARRGPAAEDEVANEAYLRGRVQALQGDLDGARALFQLATEQAPEAFWPPYEIALILREQGDNDGAIAALTKLRQQAQASGLQRGVIAALNAEAVVHQRRGDLDQARALFDQALPLAEANEDPAAAVPILTNLATLYRREDPEHARALLQRAIDLELARGLEPTGYAWNGLAQIDRAVGDEAQSEQHLRRAIEAFKRVGDERLATYPANGLARLRVDQGRFPEAIELAQAVLAQRQAIGEKRGEALTRQVLADAHLGAEQWADAAAQAEAALANPAIADEVDLQAELQLLLARCAQRLGNAAEAGEHWRQARALHGNNDEFAVLLDQVARELGLDAEQP